MHFFSKIFGHIKKKQYLCSRFWDFSDETPKHLSARSAYGGYSSVGRASDCGSECRGFEPHYPPKKERDTFGYIALFL